MKASTEEVEPARDSPVGRNLNSKKIMRVPKPLHIILISLLAVAFLASAGVTLADQSGVIQPNTPDAANAIAQLRAAQRADKGNAISFTDSNPALGHYYARKARDVNRVLERLEHGQSVTRSDVQQALNNGQGKEAYGASF